MGPKLKLRKNVSLKLKAKDLRGQKPYKNSLEGPKGKGFQISIIFIKIVSAWCKNWP
jgi:hypothetical protein